MSNTITNEQLFMALGNLLIGLIEQTSKSNIQAQLETKIENVQTELENYKDTNRELRVKFGHYVNDELDGLKASDSKLDTKIENTKTKLDTKIENVQTELENYKDTNRELRVKFGHYVNDEFNEIKTHEDKIEQNLNKAIKSNSEEDKKRDEELRTEIKNLKLEIVELKEYVSKVKILFEAFRNL